MRDRALIINPDTLEVIENDIGYGTCPNKNIGNWGDYCFVPSSGWWLIKRKPESEDEWKESVWFFPTSPIPNAVKAIALIHT